MLNFYVCQPWVEFSITDDFNKNEDKERKKSGKSKRLFKKKIKQKKNKKNK